MPGTSDAPELLRGTLDVMILKALTWGPMHGYAVIRWIRRHTEELLRVDDAALYQALYRMEQRGWLQSEWGRSENNRRAKYYDLTPRGRRELEARSVSIQRYARALLTLLASERA